MDDRATRLLNEGKITPYQHDTYMLYEGNDLGRRMLKEHLLSAVMEEPIAGTGEAFAWADGRRSCWREIKLLIMDVQTKMEMSHARSEHGNDPIHGT